MAKAGFREIWRKQAQLLFGKRMIIAKSKKDLEKMRVVGELIADVREALREMVRPGVTTLELNELAEKMMRDAGAVPTFIGYAPHGMSPFPFAICASVNEKVVHGFSDEEELVEGDILSVDMAATYDGFVGDTATTIAVGPIDDEVARLVKVTAECLDMGIAECRPGKRVGDIGWAVQQHAERHGFGIVREYTGHGIGRRMHEAPQIPNYGRKGTKEMIRPGFVFAIEPMLTLGSEATKTLSDGWTVVTADGSLAAHSEHTVAITEEGPEILTLTKTQKEEMKERTAETAAL